MKNYMSKNEDIRRERFIRIAEKRVNIILDKLESLGKCANKRNYKYTDEDAKKIFAALDKKIKEIRLLYEQSNNNRKRFELK